MMTLANSQNTRPEKRMNTTARGCSLSWRTSLWHGWASPNVFTSFTLSVVVLFHFKCFHERICFRELNLKFLLWLLKQNPFAVGWWPIITSLRGYTCRSLFVIVACLLNLWGYIEQTGNDKFFPVWRFFQSSLFVTRKKCFFQTKKKGIWGQRERNRSYLTLVWTRALNAMPSYGKM